MHTTKWNLKKLPSERPWDFMDTMAGLSTPWYQKPVVKVHQDDDLNKLPNTKADFLV